jgi:uncharacterized protein YyaL (SSP411 family)
MLLVGVILSSDSFEGLAVEPHTYHAPMPNRLAAATSPYLLQHKDNPVDWWEWSADAFEEARLRDVPVMLSVGYSACHWCHVMAHESFENSATAQVMNDRFVNVKVDREERPDVDSIYMEAVQAMSGQGGWPMTVFLTPEGEPFFAGTYFPDQPRHGMPSFRQVLEAISVAWESRRSEVLSQAQQLVGAISGQIPHGATIDEEALDAAVGAILSTVDPAHGGFGGAPKFPQQPILDFLLRARGSRPLVDEALQVTLQRMADGGIHDHLGGGFSRYSVDRRWLVPHFEKMLYDNAQLARIYLWAGLELGVERFVSVARTTLDYLLTDLSHPDGGFYSAEDADSEGEEGTFYVWTDDEFQTVLGPDDAAAATAYFGVTPEGNFEGANVLHLEPSRPTPPNLESIVERLNRHRSKRVRPGLDDKVIASWNGLAIRAFAEAGAALGDKAYLDAAENAARFVNERMTPDGRLKRSWRDGKLSGDGYLDDHSSMALANYALFQATGDVGWYESAERLVNQFSRFEREGGGFYSAADDAEPLIKRPEDLTDNPLPSGNAMAAEALLVSSLLRGDLERRNEASAALAAVGALAERYPSMVGHHLAVAESMATGTREVAIVGEDRDGLVEVFWSRYRPHAVLAQSSSPDSTVPLLADRSPGPDTALAYVCHDFVCNLPTSSPAELELQLGQREQDHSERG